jgi:HNH endonuclease
MMKTYIEENAVKVPESGCWIWNKSCQTSGYGDFRLKGKHYLAHRASYEAFNGEISKGLHVLHKCDIPQCVNPKHLFLGTNLDNIADSVSKGRRKGISRNRPSGLKYNYTKKPGPKKKLSLEKQKEMIAEFAIGGISKRALARKYGVSSAAVCRKNGYLSSL